LIEVFNSTDDQGKILRLNNRLSGLAKSSRNILKSLRHSTNPDLINELNLISKEKKDIKSEIDKLKGVQIKMTDENRKKLCHKLAVKMLKSESFEVKQYLAFAIDSIVVSNTDVELSLNIA
jgi:hypothetical protein